LYLNPTMCLRLGNCYSSWRHLVLVSSVQTQMTRSLTLTLTPTPTLATPQDHVVEEDWNDDPEGAPHADWALSVERSSLYLMCVNRNLLNQVRYMLMSVNMHAMNVIIHLTVNMSWTGDSSSVLVHCRIIAKYFMGQGNFYIFSR
jgi:hypothetical protein